MRKFYEGVIHHPKIIISAFCVLFVICLFCRQLVSVNYDINDYLPTDSPSTIAVDVMESEFAEGIPNARVMIKNVTIPQAIEYKDKLSQINGVTNVIWLDNTEDLSKPIETMNPHTLATYYKDNTALFSVVIDQDSRVQAASDIREIIGDDNAMTGSAVSMAMATTSTVDEIQKITLIAIAIVFLILVLTTISWAEPVIVMMGLGIAIIINAGTNLIFGEISFVTNASGNILQLAVSLDYSVFLIHRFMEYRQKIPDEKEAMIVALIQSTSSILSSGLTTVIGFLALVLMRFRIGPDLGLALAKGIGISLLTVFIFMPVLILACYKWIDKTVHRPLIPSFAWLGKLVKKTMIPMVVIFVLLIVPSYLASNANFFYYGTSHIFNEQTKLGADTVEIEQVFGQSDTYVLLVPKDSNATERELSDELQALPQVTDIISYVDTVGAEVPEDYLAPDILSQLNSENYTRMVLSVEVPYEGEETFSLIEKIRNAADKYYPDAYYLAGAGVSTNDLKDTVTVDMIGVNLVAIVAVFIVLLITMRSISIPFILVLGIETAVWINLSIPYFSDTPLFYIAYLIISSVQLGATVDYAILFTERYKEFRASMDKKQAVMVTVQTVAASILTSGGVLTAVGFLLGYISSHGLLSQLGFLLGKGTLCSLAVVLFVLPGMLYIFDGIIGRTTKGANFMKSMKEVQKK